MSEKQPKIRILSMKGRTCRMRFDYGKEISVTFPSDRTDEEIQDEIKKMYESYKVKPKAIAIADKIDW